MQRHPFELDCTRVTNKKDTEHKQAELSVQPSQFGGVHRSSEESIDFPVLLVHSDGMPSSH